MPVDSASSYQLLSIAEWNEDYVTELPTDEFDWLDFKTSPWLNIKGGGCLDELSKYISAYANFDGGYLIIGVHDPRKQGAVVIDGGVSVDLVRGGIDSWLEDKIPNLADERLTRLEVRALYPKKSGSAISPGRCVVIIHVPASESAPHQATDHKYYTRLSSKLSALGHRAVLDIFSRRKHPKIKIHHLGVTQLQNRFTVSALVENNSTVLARFFSLVVDIPAMIGAAALSYEGTRATMEDGFEVVRVNLTTRNNLPLFPLCKTPLEAELEVGMAWPGEMPNTISEIRYKAFADEMPFIQGAIPIDQAFNKL